MDKDDGYELVNVIWDRVPEFQSLWSRLDFDTKEDIVYTMAEVVEKRKTHKHIFNGGDKKNIRS
jgi:hypothetical protein